MTQLNSRGGLYDPVMKTRNMCSQTAMTIAWAPQRCMFRMIMPNGTSKPWYTANLGPLAAGATTVTHSLGLTNPDEIVVQFWDSGGIEPLIANVTNRTANTLDLDLEMPSAGDVHVVVARSQAN